MRTLIPEFAQETFPLQESLKAVQVQMTMQSGKGKELDGCKLTCDAWSHKIISAFKNVLVAIRKSIQLSHSYREKLMCLVSEAPDNHWGILLTQAPKAHLARPVLEQHQPLAVLSGSLNASQKR